VPKAVGTTRKVTDGKLENKDKFMIENIILNERWEIVLRT